MAEDKKAALLAEANVQEDNIIGFYNVNVLAKPVGDYTISIPMAKEYLDKAVSFYTWNEGKMSVLDLELKGNTYTGSAKCFDHLLIALGENGAAIADAETKDNSEKKYWESKLSNLKKGQCIVYGPTVENNEFKSAKPIVVNVSPLSKE